EGFADTRLARVPARAAKLVERRVRTFDDAIALDQVHALERNVQTRVFGVAEEHEFTAVAVGFDLAQPFELPDSVIDVDDEVAGLQLGKIAEESGSANLSAGALEGGRDFKEVGIAEKRDASVGESYAFREGSTDQQERGGFMRAFGGEASGG